LGIHRSLSAVGAAVERSAGQAEPAPPAVKVSCY
jgi:hypothetical protein